MEDTECACRYEVYPSSLVSVMGIGIGVSHHHFTGASPEDDIHAEGSQDPFLHLLYSEGACRILRTGVI